MYDDILGSATPEPPIEREPEPIEPQKAREPEVPTFDIVVKESDFDEDNDVWDEWDFDEDGYGNDDDDDAWASPVQKKDN